MVVIRILFWTWLAISVAIMLYRLVRRIGRRGQRMATSGVGVVSSASAENPAPSPTTRPTVAEQPPPDADPPAPAAGPLGAVDPGDTPAVTPASPAVPTADPPVSASDGAAPDGDRPLADTSIADTSIADTSIAEMVAGIRLPCDLAPMTGAEPRPGSRESVAFVATDHTAQAVGDAMTTELERLGFRVHPLAGHQVLATRGHDELKAAVHSRASGVAYGGRAAFPMAPSGSVVVELWRD